MGAFMCCSVRVDAIDLDGTVEQLRRSAEEGTALTVHLCNAYTLSLAARDPDYAAVLNRGDLNVPDGTPLVWIGRRLGFALEAPVSGSELLAATVEQTSDGGVAHYLYGSTPEVVRRLEEELRRRFPAASVVGCESPPFRPLDAREESDLVDRIRGSRARIVWVGLGTPQQDLFVERMREQLDVVLVPVGAAFDFVAGTKRRAPVWMRRRGLEWLHRLLTEPRRLWRRYLIGNAIFLACALRSRIPGAETGATE